MCKMKLRERWMYVDVYGAMWIEVIAYETHRVLSLLTRYLGSREKCVR